jgi:hypothetical protein
VIRDCSYYVRRAEILKSLAAIVSELDRQKAIRDEQLADAIKFRRAWTDPRTRAVIRPFW